MVTYFLIQVQSKELWCLFCVGIHDDQQSIKKEGNLTCSYHGVWEPNPREVCGTNSDSAVTGTDNNTV